MSLDVGRSDFGQLLRGEITSAEYVERLRRRVGEKRPTYRTPPWPVEVPARVQTDRGLFEITRRGVITSSSAAVCKGYEGLITYDGGPPWSFNYIVPRRMMSDKLRSGEWTVLA